MEPVFDTFLLVEAYVRSDVSYTIDGRLNPSFFDSGELEGMTSKTYTTWGNVRQHIFNVIKGNKLPLNFKIVLILSDANINRIIEQNHLDLSLSDIANLSLNVYFDGEKITLTTMASMNIFSMDKTLATIWDANVSAFFKQNQIF